MNPSCRSFGDVCVQWRQRARIHPLALRRQPRLPVVSVFERGAFLPVDSVVLDRIQPLDRALAVSLRDAGIASPSLAQSATSTENSAMASARHKLGQVAADRPGPSRNPAQFLRGAMRRCTTGSFQASSMAHVSSPRDRRTPAEASSPFQVPRSARGPPARKLEDARSRYRRSKALRRSGRSKRGSLGRRTPRRQAASPRGSAVLVGWRRSRRNTLFGPVDRTTRRSFIRSRGRIRRSTSPRMAR